MTPVKAIRAKCLDCCCGSAKEVRLCPVYGCPLYPFRMGHNPNIRRTYTDEQRKGWNGWPGGTGAQTRQSDSTSLSGNIRRENSRKLYKYEDGFAPMASAAHNTAPDRGNR